MIVNLNFFLSIVDMEFNYFIKYSKELNFKFLKTKEKNI